VLLLTSKQIIELRVGFSDWSFYSVVQWNSVNKTTLCLKVV